MTRRPDPHDREYEQHIIDRVEPYGGADGWTVSFGGMGLGVPNSECQIAPNVGDTLTCYGRGFCYPVRGIVIAGRVYRYETPAEHEVEQAAMRKRLTAEREERDAAFRASEKPPLALLSVNDGAAWLEYVKLQSADPYSFCCVQFAATWANLMETRGNLPLLESTAEAAQKVAEIAEACSGEADKQFGITGFMYGAAVAMLAKFWVHGDALRRWHNKDAQIGTEGDRANETGGVLNPALLTMGAAL